MLSRVLVCAMALAAFALAGCARRVSVTDLDREGEAIAWHVLQVLRRAVQADLKAPVEQGQGRYASHLQAGQGLGIPVRGHAQLFLGERGRPEDPLYRAGPNREIALMCGIVGYIGSKKATGILLEGLKRLEYRGYDSAGIGVVG